MPREISENYGLLALFPNYAMSISFHNASQIYFKNDRGKEINGDTFESHQLYLIVKSIWNFRIGISFSQWSRVKSKREIGNWHLWRVSYVWIAFFNFYKCFPLMPSLHVMCPLYTKWEGLKHIFNVMFPVFNIRIFKSEIAICKKHKISSIMLHCLSVLPTIKKIFYYWQGRLTHCTHTHMHVHAHKEIWEYFAKKIEEKRDNDCNIRCQKDKSL